MEIPPSKCLAQELMTVKQSPCLTTLPKCYLTDRVGYFGEEKKISQALSALSLRGFHDNTHLDVLGEGSHLGKSSKLTSRDGVGGPPTPVVLAVFIQPCGFRPSAGRLLSLS